MGALSPDGVIWSPWGTGQGGERLVLLKGPGEILQPSLLTPKPRGSPRVQPRGVS